MKILFVYPSWTGEYGIIAHFAKRAGVYPPLNLALLAAIAEHHGHEVSVIDGEVDCIPMAKLIKMAMHPKKYLLRTMCLKRERILIRLKIPRCVCTCITCETN